MKMAVVVALLPWAPVEDPKAPHSFKPEEVEQLVASIALYPDDLLSQVLMAATYPIEVVQAQRWADAHKTLKGDALAKELEKQDWEPSVKSLVNVPQVLQMMSERLDWIAKLGDAFLGQQKEVMDAVQRLRRKAQEAGNLKTSDKITVGTEAPIVITLAQPTVIYVPVYDPLVIYGPWAYPAYPPYGWYPPAYVPRPGIWLGVGFTMGVAWGYSWGHCNWGSSHIDINVHQNVTLNAHIHRNLYTSQTWRHDPAHRQGVPYRDPRSREAFGRRPEASRQSFRGHDLGGSSKGPRPDPFRLSRPAGRPSPGAFDGFGEGGHRASAARSRGTQSRGGWSGGPRGGGRRR